MTARSPQLEELARAPEGPARAVLLRGILGECAAAPTTTPAVLKQIAAALGEGWPAAVLRALRGVVPHARPYLLLTLAPRLDPPLAREALDLVAQFDAPIDVERVFRALAPRLADAPVVALLRVLRLIEEPPVQARLLCEVATHAVEPARGSLLAAAARVAQRTASEPERLTAAVDVAILAGGETVLAMWDTIAGTKRRDVRVRLLAALAPTLAPEQLPDRIAGLDAPMQDVEAILERTLSSLRGEVLLAVLARLTPVNGPGTDIRDRLVARALERMRGVDLLVALDAALQRTVLPPHLLDTSLGRALAELDEAELIAATPRLAGFDRARLDVLLNHAFAGLRGAALVAALERFHRCVPAFALPDAALVRAASTCSPTTRARVERLVRDGAGVAPVVLALRRGGPTPPLQLLRRGLARLAELPRKDASAMAASLTAGRTLIDLLDGEPPADRRRAADGLLTGLMGLRCGQGERAAILDLLLPRLSAQRARDALLAGVRWGQSAGPLLTRILAGRSDDEAAEILAALGTSRSRAITRALELRLASLEPDLAFALASRLLRNDSPVLAVQRRLNLLAPRLPAARALALRGDPAYDAMRLATFLRAIHRS